MAHAASVTVTDGASLEMGMRALLRKNRRASNSAATDNPVPKRNAETFIESPSTTVKHKSK